MGNKFFKTILVGLEYATYAFVAYKAIDKFMVKYRAMVVGDTNALSRMTNRGIKIHTGNRSGYRLSDLTLNDLSKSSG